MREQLKIIRENTERIRLNVTSDPQATAVKILTTLDQLEAMVGEREPVGSLLVKAGPSGHGAVFGGFVFHNGALPVGTHKLYAAPVAQQHAPEADCGSIKAQQPQAEPDAYCITTPDGGCISTDPRCMHQPQAEAVPPGCVPAPVEPTEEMLLSARDWSAAKYGKPIGDEAAKGCWGAMLDAAIAQQKGASHE